jgi:flavodoxin/predicted small lipoprotein YifL
MKRIFILLIAALMLIGLTACGENAPSNTAESGRDESASESAVATTDSAEETSKDAVSVFPETSGQQETQPAHKKVLVVVFSATGTTKGVAEKIAAIENADLYEIKAAREYTAADLNWNDRNSRSTKEQNDKSARPEIGSERISLEGYEKIYVGFPIWWGEEPRIMDTFVESYDFGNIKMIPFCTSSSSGIGRSGKNLEENAKSGTWLDGKRFPGGVSESELRSWIDGLK